MIFKIEIDDFWLDDESELEPELKNHIINTVVQTIWKKLETQVGKQLIDEIHKTVESDFKGKLDEQIEHIIKTQTIGDGEKSPLLDDWLRSKFNERHGWNNPIDVLEKRAKAWGEEMRERYDTLFASQIVIKMSEQGLLKDGVFKALMAGNKEG